MNWIRSSRLLVGGLLIAAVWVRPIDERCAADARRCGEGSGAEGDARRAGPQHERVAVAGLCEAVLYPVPD